MGFDIGGVAALTSPSGTLLMNAGASNWMSVNANGILTRGQTPFFRGQFSGRSNAETGVLYVTADANIGGCWNNFTGNFTCPVAGYYMVTGGNIALTGSGYFYIQKNGSTMHYTHWNHSSNWHYVSLSGVVSCAVSDTIQYFVGGTGGGSGFYGGSNHCMYSIALMA